MATQIIVYDWKPRETSLDQATEVYQYDIALTSAPSSGGQLNSFSTTSLNGSEFILDLFDDIAIPITYTIADVRDPSKKTTPYSKTITIPGSKKNNRIFNQIFKIDADSSFDPNLKKQMVVQQDGIEVLNGTIQLKKINSSGDYEIQLYGHLSNLFYDIGSAKLSDLDFSEYTHPWTKDTVEKSWNSQVYKKGALTNNFTNGVASTITSVSFSSDKLGRLQVTTVTGNSLQVGDFVRITGSSELINGSHIVTSKPAANKVVVNHQFPPKLAEGSLSGSIQKHNPTGEGYVYPLINYGLSSGESYDVEQLFPNLYVKTVLDKIFSKVSAKYDSQFFNSDFFKRLILVTSKPDGKVQLPISVLNRRSFRARVSSDYPVAFANGTGEGSAPALKVKYNDDAGNGTSGADSRMYDPSNVWSSSEFVWRPNENGRYRIFANISGDSVLRNKNTVTIASNENVFFCFGQNGKGVLESLAFMQFQLMIRRGGKDTPLGPSQKMTFRSYTQNSVRTVGTYGAGTLSYTFPIQNVNLSGEFDFVTTDEVWVECKAWTGYYDGFLMTKQARVTNSGPRGSGISVNWTPLSGVWSGSIKANSIIYNFPGDYITEGENFNPNYLLPENFTCADFLNGLIKMFNLYVEEDRNTPRRYVIEPRDDYYYIDQYVDWTQKVDVDTLEQIPLGDLSAKTFNFTYKEDNDYWNKLYKEEQTETYGSLKVEVKNDFLKNEQKVEVPFGASPLTISPVINTPNGADIVITHIANSNGTDQFEATAYTPRILIYGGIKPCDYDYRIGSKLASTSQNSGTQSLYPYYAYAGHLDNPRDPYYDLNFYYAKKVYYPYAVWTNHNLYNAYWRKQIDEITDKSSRLVTFSANLTPADIRSLDFRKIYVIDNVYYRLNKISDYDAANRGALTKIELSKFKLVSKWARKSIWNPGGSDVYFDVTNDYSRQIATKVFERPPQKPSFIGSGNNSINPVTLSNVTVNGRNNQVSPGVRNARVQGDENFLSPDSRNIVVQNGNGNTVAGGLENVTLIGTDKIFVSESDVTYINNVRYKFGVPISKANAINASLDRAFDRNGPTTTINVIDAGENVVLPAGSATWENVIEAGQDRVLSNLPEFGITNTNTSISRIMPYDPPISSQPATYSVRDVAVQIRITDGIQPSLYQ